MGRSKAKNTKQPSLDFKVKKKKLGKKPLPNPNVTVTTFKSKALNMPGQNIAEEKDDLVNFRNLTLKDLLSKLSHYNDQIKKDSVTGIRDLISLHPVVLHSHLGSIMNKLVEVINDLDKDVRHCTHILIGNILKMTDEITISPFIPLYSVYINSGMTHLKTSIRLDSLRLLDIFIDHFPKLVSRHCHQMIPNYIDLLKRVSGSATTATVSTSTSSTATIQDPSTNGLKPANAQKKQKNTATSTPKANSLHTRVFILKSLYKLIQVLLVKPDLSFASLLNSIHRQQYHTPIVESKLLVNNQHAFQVYQEKKIFSSIFNKYNLKNEAAKAASASGDTQALYPTILETPDELKQFSLTLLPILIDLWLELGPSNPGISFQILEDLELVVNIVHLIVHCLKEFFSTSELYKGIRKDYIKYFSGHFPFYVGSASNPDSKEWITSNSINCVMTQIASHFLGFNPTDLDQVRDWYSPFLEYIEDSLNGKLIDEKVEGRQGQAIKNHISNLLWIIKVILPMLDKDQTFNILNAFIKFDENCHPHSTSKKSCVFFIKELIDIQSNSTLSKDKSFKNIIDWGLSSLPKLLWKLGNSDIDTTLMILNILLSVGKDKTKIKQYDLIQNALVPFFFTITKESEKFPNGRQIYGPFINLPLNIQFLALNTLYYFSSLNKIMIRSLIAICRCMYKNKIINNKDISFEVISFILDLIHNLYLVNNLSISHYIAFSTAITLSITSNENQDANDTDIEMKESDETLIKRKENTDNILAKLCWNINSLRLSNPIQDILEPMTPPFINELNKLNESNSHKSLYILTLIYSTFNNNNQEDEFINISKDLIKVLQVTLFTYMFNSIKHESNTINNSNNNNSLDYIKDFNIPILLIKSDKSNQTILNILNQISNKVNHGSTQIEKNNNNQFSILLLIELFRSKELYEDFQSIKSTIKSSVLKKIESSVKEVSEKHLVEKLLLESKLLFNE
ncbi:hypothetical protein DICPUDRAFT_87805 [Dictyostelium purpureum]|uniref:Pre-rRNA-processing protein Ipi1 N-terminal domain-containing protein n=1 Tax=Dictyostelium purpureum TaxID=5786 RepID=F0ZKH9_DICPU|nr:uncharacterized protein DICPUDRAFT_87805 [Dictyostelium purpureum]EGC35558.1 hypothetical protein DICPUDRAFT_87805 [Dictyostelium purpureum]|eukprot:XP_003287929.1 hypothetical protein DICPUDRAFT_87805 [Dictyostelium purpureum]